MGIHRGPNMEKGGLIFGYDSGHGVCDNHTSSRFYQGKPTTNYLSDGLSGYNVVQGSRWNGATPTFTKGMSEFNTLVGTYNTSGTSYMYSHDYVLDDDLSTLSSQVVTFSIYLRRTDTLGTVGMRIYDNVSGYSTIYADVTGQFQRFSITKTLGANPTRIFVMIDNTNGGIIDFHSPMLEKGEASPFVDGTRSSTESLIDLKRTTDIDMSNLSFDSTGQPTFDGTDDVMSINVDEIVRRSNDITIDGIVEIPSGAGLSGGPWSILTDHSVAGDKDGFWWHMNLSSQVYFRVEDNVSGEQGVTFSGGTPFVAGNTYHITTVVGSSGVFLYVNGELSKTYNPSFNWGNISSSQTAYLNIGRTYPNYYLNSKNRVVRMYGRGLTADEIKQNYNVYKKRFNI